MFLALVALAPAALAAQALFDGFVGSCWIADFGATMRDTHCFEAMYDGAHVRDRHEVKDRNRIVYAGETIYSMDGATPAFVYFNSLGGVGRGTASRQGALLRFKGSMRASPDKAPQPIDSEWRVLDGDHYDVRSLVKSPSTAGSPVLHFTRAK